jgi:hypothetical protein
VEYDPDDAAVESVKKGTAKEQLLASIKVDDLAAEREQLAPANRLDAQYAQPGGQDGSGEGPISGSADSTRRDRCKRIPASY